jgi:hypothetical protein
MRHKRAICPKNVEKQRQRQNTEGIEEENLQEQNENRADNI